MRPVFAKARALSRPEPRKVAYAEGANPRVLRAAQTVIDENLAKPVLIGRAGEVEEGIRAAGLRMQRDRDYVLVECADDTTARGTAMLAAGEVDALVCGMQGSYDSHLEHVRRDIGLAPGASVMAAMNALVLDKLTLFIADTYVNDQPSASELAEIARLAASELQQFGLEPKVALLSHSIFGSSNRPSAQRMREAREILAKDAPQLDVIGEVHGDAALDEDIRAIYLPPGQANFEGSANLLVAPSLDAANILFNVLKVSSGKGVTVGPILLGAAKSVHILSPSATVRRIVNMTALAVANVKQQAQ
jgi:malate dehydrogenase (oxaloacetate-decarboxylating)(NADP+)